MDILRKLIHMSMGLFALALRWLSPWQAMLCALIAFLHNLYIFPLYGRKRLEKEEEKKRGYTAIVSYPAVVFVLILVSFSLGLGHTRRVMALAAASWAILAFGDAFGGILGMALKGPKLPWNKQKTFSGLISFFIFGLVTTYLVVTFFLNEHLIFLLEDSQFLILLLLAAFLAAIVESLDGQFDDNLGFPFIALSILSFYPMIFQIYELYAFKTIIAGNHMALITVITINIALAVTAFFKKWVSLWGFIFGLLVGFSVIFSLGVKGFAILCLFYLFANFSTFYGRKIKEERGIAEGNKGTRGLESVFSKGLAPAVFCWLSFEAFVVSLAFYAADTIATEFGKTSKRGSFSLLSFKGVTPGTVGAVSVKGTLAGTISILVFLTASLLNFKTFEIDLKVCTALSALVLVFFILESIINELNAKFGLTSKMVIHITLGFLIGAFANTMMLAIHWFLS